jgi:hypothetical protein
MTLVEIETEIVFIKQQLLEIKNLLTGKQDSVPFEKGMNYMNGRITVMETKINELKNEIDLLKGS